MADISLTKLVQSAFVVSVGSERYAFDFGSELTAETLEAVSPVDAVFVSHSHPDHYNANHVAVLDAPVYAAADVADALREVGRDSTALNPGDTVTSGALVVHAFATDHGPNISAPIDNLGFDIEAGEKRILFLGDMAVPSPLPQSRFDVVLVPVGGSKVFEPEAALDFLLDAHPHGKVIPIHYHGRADREAGNRFKALAGDQLDVTVLDVGESFSV